MTRLVIAALVALLLAGAAPDAQQAECSPPTPELFVTCATKALAGDFGPLKPWQEKGYRNGLAQHRVRRVWQTCYFPSEGFPRGQGCRWGIGVSERVVAANRLPAKSFVWIADPAHIRQVWDTGAKSNDRVAERRGADLWIDLWIPYIGWRGLKNDCYMRDAVLIPEKLAAGYRDGTLTRKGEGK